MASERKVLYQRYLFKLSGSEEKRKSLKAKRNHWKQKYFILFYERESLMLAYYDKKPNDVSAEPKGRISLWPAYRITKVEVDKFACEIMTQVERMCVASSDQTTLDEFVFYLQTQSSLKENLEGLTYSVFPENTEDLRRLGCVGSVCGLHVSPHGLSLTIQETRKIIAQWPLRCIRTFEASGKGNFKFEAGRHAPFGPGLYEVQTRRGQDQEMYDRLDYYVTQATSNVQASSPPVDVFNQIVDEYNKLKRLTVIDIGSRDRGPVRNSGIYDRIYNSGEGPADISDWLQSLDRSQSHAPSIEQKPPALPPRPPLSDPRPDLPARNILPGRDLPEKDLQEGPPGRDRPYEDLETTSIEPDTPPALPPRNPNRNSRFRPGINDYEDPDLGTEPLVPNTHNYQDIDEIIESLPPAPPPPSFLPPSPPRMDDIPDIPPPPIPLDNAYSEPDAPVVNPYEDLDSIAPLECPPVVAGPVHDTYTVFSDDSEPRHSIRLDPGPTFELATETKKLVDDSPLVEMPEVMEQKLPERNSMVTEMRHESPVLMRPRLPPKPKPKPKPKPGFSQRKNEDPTDRTRSMYEYPGGGRPPMERKFSYDQKIPPVRQADPSDLYQDMSDCMSGRPSEDLYFDMSPLPPSGEMKTPPTRPLTSSGARPLTTGGGQDLYFDMSTPPPIGDKKSPPQNGQDLYLDMTTPPSKDSKSPPVLSQTDGQDVYFDMTTPVTSPKSDTPELRRRKNQDEVTYFDMSGITLRVSQHEEKQNEYAPLDDDASLPFQVMNLPDFEKRIFTRSTDNLDDRSDDEDQDSLRIPRIQRSISNPDLGDDSRNSKSKIATFLYGTLRKKGRKKKKKYDEEEKESRFVKNKALRASTGRRHKNVDKGIKMASNARSFVKAGDASKRATIGGLEEERTPEPADVGTFRKRRPQLALSTPNLI